MATLQTSRARQTAATTETSETSAPSAKKPLQKEETPTVINVVTTDDERICSAKSIAAWRTAGIILVILSLLLLGYLLYLMFATGSVATGTVSVSGTGTAKAPPDVVRISIGVQSDGASVAAAAQANAARLTQALAAVNDVVGNGGNVSVETRQFESYPITNQQNQTTGYRVTNSALVTLRNDKVASASAVIDAATRAGANQVGNLDFDVDEATERRVAAEAYEKAVKDAEAKAQNLAKSAGASLRNVLTLQEQGARGPQPWMAARSFASAAADAAPIPTPIKTPEGIEITRTVDATFGMK